VTMKRRWAVWPSVDRAKVWRTSRLVALAEKARPAGGGGGGGGPWPKLGAVCFCVGGGVVNQLRVADGTDLAAGVPF